MLKSIGGGQVPSGAKIATPAVKRSRHERKGLQTFSFNSYSYKALKLIWPNLCISAKAMAVVNDFCWDLFFRVSAEVPSPSCSQSILRGTDRSCRCFCSWKRARS